ncbi:MAG: hypothetical protein LUQ09_05025 [Methanomassiliicoccales archaeon]|nr:hypothetical protein [Methanomassiliicoccales archaeon]
MDDAQKKVEKQKVDDFRTRFSALQTEVSTNISTTEKEVGEITQNARNRVMQKAK